MSTPTAVEITARDTFSTEAELEGLFTLEFLNEDTGERRRVQTTTPTTHTQAFAVAAEFRQPGEILLQVLP